jgi:hypothetical protein
MNVGIGTVAAQFVFWETLFRIFGTVSLQCNMKINSTTVILTLLHYFYTSTYNSPHCSRFGFCLATVFTSPEAFFGAIVFQPLLDIRGLTLFMTLLLQHENHENFRENSIASKKELFVS